MIEIIPGILETNFEEIQKKINLVKNLVSTIQIDVMDSTLIPNDTYNNFSSYKLISSEINLEAHLMVRNPINYIEKLFNNGFKKVMAHVEGNDIREFLHQAKIIGIEAGLALDLNSPLEAIEPYLEEIKQVLIMTVKCGSSGQEFEPKSLTKIQKLHHNYPDIVIEVDGGINRDTAGLVLPNGATKLVVTSYLFKKNKERISDAIGELTSSI